MREWPTLYKLSSAGKPQQWSISSDGASYTMVSGQVGGKLTSSTRPTTVKNQWKSNEISPSRQAEIEAQARWDKQFDKGYRLSIEDYSADQTIYPMRAGYYEKNKDKIKFPCLLQPKLNGIKLIADGLMLKSRNNKPFGANLKRIGQAVQVIACPFPLDGELYLHGVDLNDISAATKRDNQLTDKLEYWVYDVVNFEESMGTRSTIVKAALMDMLGPVRVCPTHICNSFEEIDRWHEHYVGEGFEGTIIRQMDGMYKSGPSRSADCLKNKDFKDSEFTIVDYKADIHGRIIFCCEVSNGGDRFDCVPLGTHEQREQWYGIGESFVGRQLTVRYLNLSKYGIPEGCPVGLCVRDYE